MSANRLFNQREENRIFPGLSSRFKGGPGDLSAIVMAPSLGYGRTAATSRGSGLARCIVSRHIALGNNQSEQVWWCLETGRLGRLPDDEVDDAERRIRFKIRLVDYSFRLEAKKVGSASPNHLRDLYHLNSLQTFLTLLPAELLDGLVPDHTHATLSGV